VRCLVIAGNHDEYQHYVRKRIAADPTKLTTRDFAYVYDHEVLRGRSEVHGVFIGSFRNRKDLEEIVFMIRIINKIPQGVQILPCEI
jgi:hypothetical protein